MPKAEKGILVTGAAGYVGSVCVEELLGRGYKVLAIDNLTGSKRQAVCPEAKFLQLDLLDKDDLEHVFLTEHIYAVMHFAGLIEVGASLQEPHRYFTNNVVGTINLLQMMVKYGVQRFMFSSTAAVYGEPQRLPIDENHPTAPNNPYGESKLAIERMLGWYWKAYGLKSVCLRYFNAAGATERCGEDRYSETHLIPRVLDVALGKQSEISILGNRYPTKDGTCVRDYVNVCDIVGAHLVCLEHLDELNCDFFNVGHGVGFTVMEVVEQARQITGRQIPARIDAPRFGDPAVLVASSGKLCNAFGWKPKRSDLRTILETAWAWRLGHPNGYASVPLSASHPEAAESVG